jgi:hypothetical protein
MKTKKINITPLLYAVALGLFSISTRAQVVIGFKDTPVKAALLELSEQPADADNVTSTKGGLVLPRVKLTAKDNLAPFIQITDPEWQASVQNKTKAEHVGLTVYNLTSDAYFTPGTYVWNGEKWILINVMDEHWDLTGNSGTTPGLNFIGTTDTASLSFGTSNTAWMKIDSTGKIDVKGALQTTDTLILNDIAYMDNLPESLADDVSQMMLDSAGQVCIVQTSSGNNMMFNYLTYRIENVDGCTLDKFNTNIPQSQYTLVIVGSNFDLNILNKEHLVSVQKENGYNPQKIVSRTINGLWHLSADYIGGQLIDGAGNKVNGTWQINCIAINNAVMQPIVNNLTFDLGGNNSGAALQMPAGL